MTMYRKQLIPFRQWGYRVTTVADMTAIVDPLRGALAYVDDDNDLYQHDGTAWVGVTDGAESAKVGFLTVTQAVDLDQLETDTIANNAKIGIDVIEANVSSANILAMFATPVTIIPAQAGKVFNLFKVISVFTAGGTQYAGGGNVVLKEETSGTQLSGTLVTAAQMNGAASLNTNGQSSAAIGLVLVANKAVQISNTTAAFTTGTGTLKIIVYYKMVTI